MFNLRALLIITVGLLPGLSHAVGESSDNLLQAKKSVVKIIVKPSSDNLKALIGQLASDPKQAKSLLQQIINALSKGDNTISVGSGVVVSKSENSAYVVTSVPVNKYGQLYVSGAEATGNDEVEFAFQDEGKSLYFLKYKVVRDSLKPIQMVESNKEYREKNLGSKVYLIAYPGSAEISTISAKEATVSASTVSAQNKVDASNTALIQTDHLIQQGSQGGALVNERGEMIGVVRKEGHDDTLLAKLILKVASASKLFVDANDTPAQAFATPTDFVFDFLKTKNIEGFQYKKTAEAAVAPVKPAVVDGKPVVGAVTGTTGSNGGLLWMAVSAGLLVLGGGAFFALRSRATPATAIPLPTPGAGKAATRVVLKYVGGDAALQGKQWPLTKEGVTIGRSGEIQLNTKEASNEHAKVALDGGEPVLQHLSTTNSTLVNTRPVSGKVALKMGDKIQIAVGGIDLFVVERS